MNNTTFDDELSWVLSKGSLREISCEYQNSGIDSCL
jgi:hypothetical protein